MSAKKPRLTVVHPSDQDSPLRQLADPQFGALAEAEALADVLNVVAVDQATIANDSHATLTHMLRARLLDVRTVIETEAFGGQGGAA